MWKPSGAAQGSQNALDSHMTLSSPSSSLGAAFSRLNGTNKACVVCENPVSSWEPFKFCSELLWNRNIGEFLLRFEVVPSSVMSLDAPLCHGCWHCVTTADKASAIFDENLFMLRSRRRHVEGESQPSGEPANRGEPSCMCQRLNVPDFQYERNC